MPRDEPNPGGKITPRPEGEVVYRGEVHHGEHQPIIDPALFAAVQGKLAAQAVARRCRLRGSSALLTGRIFDERGNRMSPTHTNRDGVRYRYYRSSCVAGRDRGSAGPRFDPVRLPS